MENIKLTEPKTNKEIEVEISPEEYNQQQAWRIKLKDGKSALIGLGDHGIWQHLDGSEIDPKLITLMGKSIEDKQQRNH